MSYNWGDIARSYFNTTLFCIAIAITIWLLGLAEPLWASFAVSFSIGYCVSTTAIVLQPLFIRFMSPFYASIPTTLIGVGLGVALGGYLILGDARFFFLDENFSTPILALFFGILGLLFFTTQSKLEETRAALADARATQLIQDKAHLETQLKLLQAQIEPHFLFNTLSNVVGMIRDQPEGAEQTLINLTTLLRANLQRTRARTTTISDELAIIEALLKINQIRMGERLHFEIHVDENLDSQPLPPMLLQPLVENALKHGIEPLEDGGWVRIQISATAEQLDIQIKDTGVGLHTTAVREENGSGVGIANVQNRLVALFGDAASLTLEENQPQGMIAHLSLPRTLSATPSAILS